MVAGHAGFGDSQPDQPTSQPHEGKERETERERGVASKGCVGVLAGTAWAICGREVCVAAQREFQAKKKKQKERQLRHGRQASKGVSDSGCAPCTGQTVQARVHNSA